MYAIQTIDAGSDPGFLRSIVSNIPTDAAAIFVYALVIGSLWLIWWANRKHGGSPRQGATGAGSEEERSREGG